MENFRQSIDAEQQTVAVELEINDFDYSKRAPWLRAAVLGANDGLVSTASLMMGIGAVKDDVKPMILAGFAGLVAGACSMAIGEFVSVYSQLDIERAQIRRNNTTAHPNVASEPSGMGHLSKPMQAALASAIAYAVGATVPLLSAAFISNYKVRLGVVAAAASIALVIFGGVGAVLGNASVKRACLRVLVGGWLAMAVTFGLTRSVARNVLQ